MHSCDYEVDQQTYEKYKYDGMIFTEIQKFVPEGWLVVEVVIDLFNSNKRSLVYPASS